MPLSEKKISELVKRDARVLAKIQGRKDGIGFGKLAQMTGLENNRLRSSTRRLCAGKSIKMLGAGRTAFYLDAKLSAPAKVVKAKKAPKRTVGKVARKPAVKRGGKPTAKRRSKAKKTK